MENSASRHIKRSDLGRLLPNKGNNLLDSVRRRAVYGGHDALSLSPFRFGRDLFVPNRARRSVIFVGDLTDRGVFRPRGTAFLVGIPSSKAGLAFPYLVTAQHVVVMLQEQGNPIYCRLNRKDGPAAVEPLNVSRWWYHPDDNEQTDVAVAAVHLNFDIADHEPIPMPEKWEANPLQLAGRDIGLGDETFAIGLFRRHAGTERNVPIIRVGNVAALPEELVSTKWGLMKAYLVEMRSIAGLSGSPVFVDLPSAPMTFWGGMVPDPRYKPLDPNEALDWFQYRFLGLVHGHFDIPNMVEDSVVEDDAEGGSGINTGIGLVIPAEKIIQTLYQPELIAEREQIELAFEKEHAATPDDATYYPNKADNLAGSPSTSAADGQVVRRVEPQHTNRVGRRPV